MTLEIPVFQPYEWTDMSIPERRKHLEDAGLKLPRCGQELSVTPEETGIRGIAIESLQDVWESASKIFHSCSSNIVCHPKNSSKYIVFDEEHSLEVVRDKDAFTCQCHGIKTLFNLFCCHTIAVAEMLKCLMQYIIYINTRLNLMSVSGELNMFCTKNLAGKKGGGKRKGKNNNKAVTISEVIPFSNDTFPQSQPTAVMPLGTGNVVAHLPPMTAMQLSMQAQQPFTFTFRHGLISRCYGCSRLFCEKTWSAPHDLILKKRDFREYPNPRDGK